MNLGASQNEGEVKVQTCSQLRLWSGNFIGYHDYQPDPLKIRTAGIVPLVPNEVAYAESRRLIGKLAAQDRVWCDYNRNTGSLNQNWGKDGDGLARACGKNGNNVVMFGFENST
jgi:hypothetical protein